MTTLEVGCIEPPIYDCQKANQVQSNLKRLDTWNAQDFKAKKFNKVNKKFDDSETSLLETDSEERENIPEDRFLILGFNQGQVVIYNIFKFDIPISRHEVCRNKILMIREVRSLKMYLIYDD